MVEAYRLRAHWGKGNNETLAVKWESFFCFLGGLFWGFAEISKEISVFSCFQVVFKDVESRIKQMIF